MMASADETPAPVPEPVSDEAIEEEVEEVPETAKHRTTWKDLARKGEHEKAIALVEASFGKLVKTLGQADLWELAKSARLARRGTLAVAALEAYRTRFPDSARAATAAFLLGRVEMDLNKKPAKAARWFQSYLDDSPGGSLAEEALGRLITALRKAGNEAAASKAAARYLEKYPTGTYREIALAVASNS